MRKRVGLWRAAPAVMALAAMMAPAMGQVSPTWFTVNGVIQTSGTAYQLPSAPLVAGSICLVVASGSNQVSIGASSAVTDPQLQAWGANSVGIYLGNGQGWPVPVNNSKQIWINGTAGDGIQCGGG